MWVKLVSNKLTYFKSNVDINVAGISDPNTIKGLEEQQVIYKVIPNSEFYLREYPSKIKRHWYIDLLEPRNGKYKWYAFEDDFSKP